MVLALNFILQLHQHRALRLLYHPNLALARAQLVNEQLPIRDPPQKWPGLRAVGISHLVFAVPPQPYQQRGSALYLLQIW